MVNTMFITKRKRFLSARQEQASKPLHCRNKMLGAYIFHNLPFPEGYEKLARAKGVGTSMPSTEANTSLNGEKSLLSDDMDSGLPSATFSTAAMGTSNPNLVSAEVSGSGADDYDMFADDENTTTKHSDENNVVSQPSTDAKNSGGALQNDYVYDESSGYYYSSSLGYYYDPNTGLYCSAVSGQWYSFNEETNTYDEVKEVASNTS
ncbi:hypothetical protein Ahy_B10g101263 isoform A [Arachis hypogaea]|uniref:OCRE domain-containing protein n=1 Tax=Arachis hypogaea TaxID=3818 RepID=A0A444WZ75_ARAHY|nr:hypothetical protein Ahy_B10g101263 isoform A [Arachis hypogaea]